MKASAARITASTFGILAGPGGMTHGIGEVIQGNIPANGIVINSWTTGPIATNPGGEPAITLIPNLLITGTVTIIVSLDVLVWSTVFIRKRGGEMDPRAARFSRKSS